MALLLKALAGISALILLVVTLLGSIITLGGFLLTAIKVLIVVIFVAVITMVVVSILRRPLAPPPRSNKSITKSALSTAVAMTFDRVIGSGFFCSHGRMGFHLES